MARYDAGSTLQGATSGAAAGAAVGGTPGAIIGGTVGAVTGFFGSKKKKRHKGKGGSDQLISTLDPVQQQLRAQQAAAVHGEGPLKNLYKFNPSRKFYNYNPNKDRFKKSPFHEFNPKKAPYRFNPNQEPYQFNPDQAPYQFNENLPFYNFDTNAANQNFETNIARPAYRSFNENIVPSITGQFRQNNLGNSTYAGEALANKGRDVQESLDAARANMIYQGQQQAEARKYQGYLTSNERQYEGFQNAENRRYEGFKTSDERKYAGYQTADQRKFADYQLANERQYAGRMLADERAYTGYQNEKINRGNALNHLLDMETQRVGPAPAKNKTDQFFQGLMPVAQDYLANQLNKPGAAPTKQSEMFGKTNQLGAT